MCSTNAAASSAYFEIPTFSKGDLEEVMMSLRSYDITEISQGLPDRDLPYFPFPDEDVPRNRRDARTPDELN